MEKPKAIDLKVSALRFSQASETMSALLSLTSSYKRRLFLSNDW